MTTETPTSVSRRQALRRGVTAGAVIWAAPLVVSSTADATGGGGSYSSQMDGPMKSVDCQWTGRNYRPRAGAPGTSSVDLSGVSFCEVNGGQGWKVISQNDIFTVLAESRLSFRHLQGSFGESGMPSAAAAEDEAPSTEATVPPTTPEPVESTTATTEAPTTTEPTVPASTEAPVTTGAPDTSEAPATTDAPVATQAPVTTAAPESAGTTTTTSAPADPAPTVAAPPAAGGTSQTASDAVETITIDMSGRTDLNIGDVYGYFQIVDATPA